MASMQPSYTTSCPQPPQARLVHMIQHRVRPRAIKYALIYPNRNRAITLTLMALSSDQQSTTPTPTDPDLHFTPTHIGGPSHPPHNSMYRQNSLPHDRTLVMENLEQLWSHLSIGNTNEENVSYVCIPVDPRAAIAWNQLTQTPSMPLRLELPPQNHSRRLNRGHIRVRRSVHPY